MRAAEDNFRELYKAGNSVIAVSETADGRPAVSIGDKSFVRRHLAKSDGFSFLLFFTADDKFRIQFPLYPLENGCRH